MTYYYQHPRPDLMISALRAMSKEGWLKKENSKAPVAAFLARLLSANADRWDRWTKDLTGETEDEKSIFTVALWMGNDESCRKALAGLLRGGDPAFKQEASQLLEKRPPNLLGDDIDSPQFLDALWGSFLATGDERYVQRLISTLPLLDRKDDIMKMLIGGAAKWSLTSNAVQHPKVMEICEAELKVLPENQKPALMEVIESARKRKNSTN